MKSINLRCEYLVNPLGLDTKSPRLSWILEVGDSARRGVRQTAYRICVAKSLDALTTGKPLLWDTGKVRSSAMNQIAYAGAPLASGLSCVWRVMVWDEKNQPSEWSEPASWSMGLLNKRDWVAQWIESTDAREQYKLYPSPMMRREFSLAQPVRRATAYVTALGLYELRLNGAKVGSQVLAPEWTDYHKRVQVQTFDVTSHLRPGANAVGAILADGWYAGRLGLQGPLAPPAKVLYGTKPAFLLQLHVELEDGTVERVVSDGKWVCTLEGPIRSASLLGGEHVDARKELTGWDSPGFSSEAWSRVKVRRETGPALVAQRNEAIRVTKDVPAVAVTEPSPGVYIVDFGQNMVGWCRLQMSAPEGTTVTLRHAEVLNPDGSLYRENLRIENTNQDSQVDVFTAAGQGVETFEPRFTYHGFRYVEITGLASPPALNDIVGRVIHSDAPMVGGLACSDPALTKLFENIVWTQRGNMHGVPTDCPQRDERLGWSGDAQIYSQTAMFTMDMAAFFTKWLQDVRDAQARDGRFPDFAPHPYDSEVKFSGNPGWADAGVVVPWRLYTNYGDTRVLVENYEAGKRWVEFIHRHNPDLIWKDRRNSPPIEYGDWLNGNTLILENYPRNGGEVPRGIHATAFYAHSTDLVARMAEVLGHKDEARKYRQLLAGIKEAFRAAFVSAEGRIEGDTQAGYALALAFDLLPEKLRPLATERMVKAVEAYQGRISTGIQSTLRLMLALTRFGRDDIAWKLMTNRQIPSWLYMVDHGATTVWERWDGWVEGRGFQSRNMNSFNHWAIGAVGEWMMRAMVGINDDPTRPGYARIAIHPRLPAAELSAITWAEGHYDSIRGRIQCRWERTKQRITVHVEIPANATATVFLPTQEAKQVSEGNRPLLQAPGVKVLGKRDQGLALQVGSGSYVFKIKMR